LFLGTSSSIELEVTNCSHRVLHEEVVPLQPLMHLLMVFMTEGDHVSKVLPPQVEVVGVVKLIVHLLADETPLGEGRGGILATELLPVITSKVTGVGAIAEGEEFALEPGQGRRCFRERRRGELILSS
jgi:hypothetical protein